MSQIDKSSKIIIVGSGVFGISTALWLARAGYGDVTVLDKQDTETSSYDPSAGIESASADLNKIIRFSYGPELEYQRLATEAAKLWEEWNDEIEATPDDELPEQLRGGAGKLWWNVGFLRMGSRSEFSDFELETLENMSKEGLRSFQYKSDDPADLDRARAAGWINKLDPCHRHERFGTHKAVLDTTAGFVYAYKSCAWAQHLARKHNVKFILDPVRGRVVNIRTRDGKPILETIDGSTYSADLVVVAGGGWTPSLLPESQNLLETTGGSVVTIQIPDNRADLWDRFSPEKLPVITWGMKEGKDVYSFPRDENGIVKIGWRKTKFTNFETVKGQRISVPRTAYVTDKKENGIPMDALDGIKEYISINFPELVALGFASTRLCWYSDSIDNSFVVDFVPGRPGVAVCSGGSGHGFKFLPILGREVVKILEGKGGETVYGNMWKWRVSTSGTRNGLEEGEPGPRVLAKQRMATEEDLLPN